MSAMKELMIENEELRQTALAILCEADVLEECPYHCGTYTDCSVTGNLTLAYQIANAKITAGEIDCERRVLTDAIQEQGELYWPATCPGCEKW
jgi:hypothetical protein